MSLTVFTDDHRTETMAGRRERRLRRMREGRKIWEEGLRTEMTVADLRKDDWLLEVPAQFNRRARHFGGRVKALVDGYRGVGLSVEGTEERIWVPMHFVCVVMRERLKLEPDQIRCLVCRGQGLIRFCKHDRNERCGCTHVYCPNPGCVHRR